MIKKFRQEIWRLKIAILLTLQLFVCWGLKDIFNTLSLVMGLVGVSLLLGYFVQKELFKKYNWDVGKKLNEAWDTDAPYRSRAKANLAIGMLFARLTIYLAIMFAVVLIVSSLRGM